MADIDVVKKRSSMSLWIIAVVIIALVLFALFALGGRSTGSVSPTSRLTTPSFDTLARV